MLAELFSRCPESVIATHVVDLKALKSITAKVDRSEATRSA